MHGASEPSWSRDGLRLVFLRHGGVWTSDARGHGRREVVPASRIADVPFEPSWSPDASRIVFAVVREEPAGGENVHEFHEVWTVGADGSGLRKLGSGGSPAWSPDGAHIAFARTNGSVVWVRAAGGRAHRLARLKGFTRSLDFSPNGRRLVFQNDDSIRTLNVRTRKLRGFADKRAGNPVQVRWAPNGRRIAYLQWNFHKNGPADPSEIRTIKPSGHGRRNVLTFPGPLLPFEFSWR
jgi:Tol biopolymer transport system component